MLYEITHPLYRAGDLRGDRAGPAPRPAPPRGPRRSCIGPVRRRRGALPALADVGDAEAVDALCGALRRADEREHHTRVDRACSTVLLEMLPPGDRALARRVRRDATGRRTGSSNTGPTRAAAIGIRAMRTIDQLAEASRRPRATRRGEVPPRVAPGLGGGRRRDRDRARHRGEATCSPRSATRVAFCSPRTRWVTSARSAATPARTSASRARVLADAEAAGDGFAELQAICSLVWALLVGGHVRSRRTDRRARRSRMPRAAATGTASGTSWPSRVLLRASAGRRERRALRRGPGGQPRVPDTLLPDFAVTIDWLAGDLARAAAGRRDCRQWSRASRGQRRMWVSFAAAAAIETRADGGVRPLVDRDDATP